MVEVSGQYYYGVGRRKTASAQVRLYPGGDGSIVINQKPSEQYFTRPQDLLDIRAPLKATGTESQYTVTVIVVGGGITGQAGAVRHGIARALLKANPDFRGVLRQGGFLTRDPREKERKKAGLKRARKRPQYTKR